MKAKKIGALFCFGFLAFLSFILMKVGVAPRLFMYVGLGMCLIIVILGLMILFDKNSRENVKDEK